jgi:hypothetical protein
VVITLHYCYRIGTLRCKSKRMGVSWRNVLNERALWRWLHAYCQCGRDDPSWVLKPTPFNLKAEFVAEQGSRAGRVRFVEAIMLRRSSRGLLE